MVGSADRRRNVHSELLFHTTVSLSLEIQYSIKRQLAMWLILLLLLSNSYQSHSSPTVSDPDRNKLDVNLVQHRRFSELTKNHKATVETHVIDDNLMTSSDDPPASSTARFLTPNGTVVTAQRGSTASLPCEVLSLGDGVVTWFRRKDFHLLTVGHAVYSSDERFHVQGPPRSVQTQDWALQIRFVQERDAGLYECQLSTHPPSSLFIELVAVEARAEIEGGPEKYVKSGSTLKLICHIRQSSVAPDFVFWYHDGRMINYEGARGVTVLGDATSSTLIIGKAQSSHSGNYSCVPSNVRPASVIVHILNGEKPAAMQHSNSISLWHRSPGVFLISLLMSVEFGSLSALHS